MPAAREINVNVSGLTIHCLEWGTPGGEPLLLIHGFLDQAHSWKPLVERLQQSIDRPLWIVAPDCRGHGDSGWIGSGGYYHFPDYVLDLDCVVRALGVSRFKLVGHSMGGTISFLYAGTFPDRVSRLVLIEGIGPIGMNFSDAPVRMQKWLAELHERGRDHFREYLTIEAGARQLQRTNSRLDDKLAVELARAGMKQNGRGKWVWKFDPLHRTTAPQPFYSFQAIEFLRRIECPVLIVEGKESQQTQRPDKQARLDALRARRFAQVDNAGHMVHQDNPQALAALLADFLFSRV
jgi:pimeloyl-ACP methyl ester carboxylesterase